MRSNKRRFLDVPVNNNYMKRYFPGRFAVAGQLCQIFLGLSFITRLGLLIYSASSASWNVWELMKSFAVGYFFDIVAFGYFMIPYILFTLLIGPRVSRTKVYSGLVWFFFSLTIFIYVFNAVAEFFFWDEFEVRYNFIAVDYLVYTNEVIGNIQESYPLPVLIGSESLIAGLIIWWVYRKRVIQEALKSEQTFTERLKIFGALLLIPVFSFAFVTLNWSQISKNSYNCELAKNGIYSIFEAFKNNQLDYNRFYKIGDNK